MRDRTADLLVGAALLFLGSREGRAQIDPFYVDVELEAQSAIARGDTAAAAKLYRVACFGMLDEPAKLAACTVRLAKAQAAAKDLEGFRASYLRLATVEQRFQGLTRSDVPIEEKRELAHLAVARLTRENLAMIPELSALIAADEAAAQEAKAKPSKAKPKSRRARSESPLTPEPSALGTAEPEATSSVEQEIPEARGAADEVGAGEKPVSTSPETSHAEAEPVPERSEKAAPSDTAEVGREPEPPTFGGPPTVELPPAGTPTDEARLEEARKRLAERPDRATVESELEAVRSISDRSPGDVAAARLAGDLAYLLGRWPVCADYYQRAGDPGPELPLGRFYMAVCLFETGQTEGAAKVLAPSADRLKRTPFVNGYLARILGSSTPP